MTNFQLGWNIKKLTLLDDIYQKSTLLGDIYQNPTLLDNIYKNEPYEVVNVFRQDL